MKDFRSLKVWEESHKLVLDIYSLTQDFPDEERFGLTSQMRRAASSIPTNIAEGCGFNSDAQLNKFLLIASGSTSELEYLLELSFDLGFIKEKELFLKRVNQIKKMLYSFSSKLNSKTTKQPSHNNIF